MQPGAGKVAQGSFSVDRHQEFQIRLAIAAISSLRLHDSTHLSNSMGRLALCIGGHDAGPEAFTRSCSGRTALTLHQLRAKSVSFVDTVHAGEPYHQSQNGYWDEYGQWVAEAEKEAQADAEAENLNTQRELALADPASVVEIASQKAGKAITRAENNSADAQVLHMRLHAQKATNLVRYFRDELRELMRRRSTAGLKRQLDSLDQYLDTLKTCEHHNSGRCNKLSKRALSGLGHDAGAAAHAVEQLIQTSRNAKRRTFPILDLLRTGIGPAPDQLDALDAPTPPDYVPPPGPVPGTAAGCNCAPHSHCAGRGREFPWCKVNRTEPCSLLSERSFVDASGADHRVAGSGQPPAVWDYCGPPKENSETVHAGAHCERRDDIVARYHDDPDFWDKDGKFNWNKVPRRDRMTVEAMVVPKEGQGLCMRTPSSGAHYVCPTAQDDLDEARPEGTEWARTRTWDFCVPAAPEEKIKVLQELAQENQIESQASGVEMQDQETFRKPFEKDPATETQEVALQQQDYSQQPAYDNGFGGPAFQQGFGLSFLAAALLGVLPWVSRPDHKSDYELEAAEMDKMILLLNPSMNINYWKNEYRLDPQQILKYHYNFDSCKALIKSGGPCGRETILKSSHETVYDAAIELGGTFTEVEEIQWMKVLRGKIKLDLHGLLAELEVKMVGYMKAIT
ncbi:unnamed protein product [Symbiodinium sp. KB8]|nr:unnamed protein product [Symbiodinium sp. KB8]